MTPTARIAQLEAENAALRAQVSELPLLREQIATLLAHVQELDMASYGIVKVLEGRHGDTYPDMPWEPKAAFTALAAHYRA